MKLSLTTTMIALSWVATGAVLLGTTPAAASAPSTAYDSNVNSMDTQKIQPMLTTDARLEIQAATEAAVADTLEALNGQDLDGHIDAFEGAVVKLEDIADEIQTIEPTGVPHLDGLLTGAKTSLENFFQMAPKVLDYMQRVRKDTNNNVDAKEATSSVRGGRPKDTSSIGPLALEQDNADNPDTAIDPSSSDTNGSTTSSGEARSNRNLLQRVSANSKDPSTSHNGYAKHYAKHNSHAHHFERNPRASHQHQKLTKLHDAVMGGDEHHINSVLGSLAAKVDGSTTNFNQGRRQLWPEMDKAKQCYQLTKCGKDMSFYDTLVFFHSDDIDPSTGEIDKSILHFDEKNLEAKYQMIKSTAQDLYRLGGDDVNKYMDTFSEGITVFADNSLCMDYHSGTNNIYMDPCSGSTNQAFRYNPTTMQLQVKSKPNACVEVDYGNNMNVRVHSICNGEKNQRWYMTNNNELKTMHDDKCLDWDTTNNNLYMHPCTGNSNQMFSTPTGSEQTKYIDPAVGPIIEWPEFGSTTQRQCVDKHNDGDIYTHNCHYENNQLFTYNPTSKALQVLSNSVGTGCLEVDFGNSMNVRVHDCNQNNNQQWYLTDDNKLKTNYNGNDCLTRQTGSGSLYMAACQTSGHSQKWVAPMGHMQVAIEKDSSPLGTLKHKGSGDQCMDVNPGQSAGSIGQNVHMHTCHYGSNQMFSYNPIAMTIEAPGFGCLDYDPNTSNVKVFPCHGKDNQKWYMTGANELKSKFDATLCLDMDTNDNIYMSACNGNDNQKFVTDPFDWFPSVSSNYKCDTLLELFHRNVEFDGVPHWEGGTVSQVCLAEGSQVFVRLDEISHKIGSYAAKKVSDEIFSCTKDLYDSNAPTNEPFPFATTNNPSGPSDLVIPTGLNMENRNKHGMIVDITEPVYTMGTDTATYMIEQAVGYAEWLYIELWKGVQVHHRGNHLEPGSVAPVGIYQGHEYWKNKYFRADKLMELLEYLTEDLLPPGLNGKELVEDLWMTVNTLNAADSSFTGDDKDYAKHLQRQCSTKVTGTFEAMQHGYDLVFGDKTSVGFLCGVRDAVEKDPTKWPGTCCLDAPYQHAGDSWGRKFDCGSCSNPGPFFSGIHEDSCSANGGTWCANPTNCTALKTCLQGAYDNANSTGRLSFVSYLEPGLVDDPTDAEDCGSSREYFGFDALYSNDEDVCDNVMQLHNSKSFAFLDDFFDQGTEIPPGGAGAGQGVWNSLKQPSTARSTSTAIVDSQSFRAKIFAMHVSMDNMKTIVDILTGLKCPGDPTGGSQTACAAFINKVFVPAYVLYGTIKTAAAVAEFALTLAAEETDLEAAQTNENISVLYENTDAINKNMRLAYEDITLVYNKVDTVLEQFKDSSNQLVTISDVMDEIAAQCGGSTRGRALHVEDADDITGEVPSLLRKQNDEMNAKLDQQQKLLEQQQKQLDQQLKILVQLLATQPNQHGLGEVGPGSPPL